MINSLCLNMIVRDESPVILRCLESVVPLINYWVIVDTGSKDDTAQKIEAFFKDKKIPGELHHKKWVNFEKNRNQALKLAKKHGDYLLFIDADEQLIYESDFQLPKLDKDSYLIRCNNDTIFTDRRLIVRADLDWKWVGQIHETIECAEAKTLDTIPHLINFASGGGGARSLHPTETREGDAKTLENILKDDPKNSRALFYLGLTYLLLLKFEKALVMFKRRAKYNDASEEYYVTLLQIAKIMHGLKKDPDKTFKAYLKAIKFHPARAESYFYLARFLRGQKDLKTAYEVAKKGLEYTGTQDHLAVESRIYDFGMALEFSVIAVGVDDLTGAREAAVGLLQKPNLPENVSHFIKRMWDV